MKKNDTNYVLKTNKLFVTTNLLEQIQIWCRDSSIKMEVTLTQHLFKDEFNVILGFQTEEELSLFSLRWASDIDKCFQNSLIKQLYNTYSLITERHRTDRETIPGKKDKC